MEKYTATIGLEIHAQLKTKSKMFSFSPNDPDANEPNRTIDPVDVAHPGTLPTINKQAVKHVITVGYCVGGTIADFTEFDRKNYFYPDIPKGYQISQYKYPFVSGGVLAGVALTRIHLEEDTGRSLHDKGEYSLVDYNRAGMPLMELVTEPVIHDAQTAVLFAKELQLLLRTIGASDAHMEKGQMRVEVNISVSKTDARGTKVEIKNINSFSAVGKAIEYEMKRQIEILESGGVVVQQTRGWDENSQSTVSQRSKENVHDYRYFPDPDLPKMYISQIPEFSKEVLMSVIPELPEDIRKRYKESLGIKAEDIEFFVYNREWCEYFELVCSSLESKRAYQVAANILITDIVGTLQKENKIISDMRLTYIQVRDIVLLFVAKKISSRSMKDLITAGILENIGDIVAYVQAHNMLQEQDDTELAGVVSSVLLENPDIVDQFKAGKESVINYLLGKCMQTAKGKGNPERFMELLLEIIKK